MNGRRFRPLDRMPSIKLKLGALIVAAVAVTSVVIAVGHRNGWSMPVLATIGMAIGLVMVHLLARGMTYPLREMAAAATEMARGRHDRRVTATSRDEVGDLARAFNQMAAELAEVDRVRRDFVANASHELRTPIGALRALMENVVDGVEDADRDTTTRMLMQVERLGRLVDQLLDLSRLESGSVPFSPRPVIVGDVVETVVRDARLTEPSVVFRTSGDMEATVHGDADRIQQVVGNLVDNAARHSPAGGVVGVEIAGGDGRVRISVTDAGPGISPEDAERVFERFYRADTARPADGGVGLGLAIARWIVDLHGGEIRVEQADRPGCRMVVELNAARP